MIRFGFLCVLLVALSACDTSADSAPLPTTTLLAPLPTLTFTSAPPTVTPQSLPAPIDLIEALPPQPTPGSSTDLTTVDPVAAELVALAQSYVAEQNDLSVRRVRVVDVQQYVWQDTSLGCPSAGVVYAPALVDGYRIVLTTGEQFHVFHTDFDRIVPCAPENEVLPE